MGRSAYDDVYDCLRVMWRECDHELVYPVIKECDQVCGRAGELAQKDLSDHGKGHL